MTRNLIILLMSSGFVSWCIYILKNRKAFSSTSKRITAVLFIIWLLIIFLPNIPVVLHPLSPLVKGKVVDAITNEPITNCNIKAYWEIESATPQGGHWQTYYQYATKTDSKGEFQLPRHLKVLSNYGLFPLPSYYGGVRIFAFTHGYKHSGSGVEHMLTEAEKKAYLYPQIESITIKMDKSAVSYLMSDISSLAYSLKSSNMPHELTSEDKKYLHDDYLYYYERVPSIFNSLGRKEMESVLISFASAFKEYGNSSKAIEVYEQIKSVFPESGSFADQEIKQLRELRKGQPSTQK